MDTRNVLSAAGQAGCSALSWTTLDGRHLWGRNFDLDCHPLDSAVLYLPRGTAYRACEAGRGRGRRRERQQISTYGTVGVGSTAAPAAPILYEGINERGLMGGHVHKPLMDLTEKEREELAEVLAPYLERYPLHRPE